jgi:asparagine synthase (glutamine-hydrolysing)
LLNSVCNIKNPDGLLLSGGLDSSILAYHLKPKNAITIIVDNCENSPDYYYSSLIQEKKYVKEHHKVIISFEDVIVNIEQLIKEYKTFDPIFLKNSVVQLIGFKFAKELKINSLAIGDGADELFAGYNFLHKYIGDFKKINNKIDYIIQNMDFFSVKFSNQNGFNIFLPYLEAEIVKYSKSIALQEKISSYNGILFGKFFLRKCYETIIGKEIAWRKKTALQDGSGVHKLEQYIENNRLKDDGKYSRDLEKIRSNEGVKIRSKEHLFLYKTYRRFYKAPVDEINSEIDENTKKCKSCSSLFIWNGNFCKVCGAFPAY